jgi:tRNA G26 N,N-dimethylase Trm1
MWLAPIHDTPFVQRVLKSIEGQEKEYGTWTRINGMLSLAANVSWLLPV